MVDLVYKIELVYAPFQQHPHLMELQVSANSTVKDAILGSGILQLFPEIDLRKIKVGIFSQLVLLTTRLHEGDRIEIYRPLKVDPKQARLLRMRKKNN